MAAACTAIVNFPLLVSSSAVGQRTVSLNRGSLFPLRKQIGMKFKLLVQKPAYHQPSSSALRAASPDEALSTALTQTKETWEEMKTKWETLENKSIFGTYAAGAIVLFWFSSSLVGAISPVPLLPKFLELVGLGYSSWFTYRYLLFKANREELTFKINAIKDRIVGTIDELES